MGPYMLIFVESHLTAGSGKRPMGTSHQLVVPYRASHHEKRGQRRLLQHPQERKTSSVLHQQQGVESIGGENQ